MATRRRMTLRRIDPWSVLKFGFVVNVCLLAVGLIGFGIVWFVIGRIGLIEQACDMAARLAFENCGINGGNLFQLLLLLGVIGVIIQTGLFVLFAFLHNLIADLVGGISVTLIDEGSPVRDAVTSRSTPVPPIAPPMGSDGGLTAARTGTSEPVKPAASMARPEPTRPMTTVAPAVERPIARPSQERVPERTVVPPRPPEPSRPPTPPRAPDPSRPMAPVPSAPRPVERERPIDRPVPPPARPSPSPPEPRPFSDDPLFTRRDEP